MSRYLPRIDRAGGAGGATPFGEEDAFVAGIMVGNVPAGDPNVTQAAPFEYIPDPGDGSGLEAALVSASVRSCDVWIRPGTYTLDPANVTLPMNVPANVTVRGAGQGLVVIVGGDGTGGTTQEIFNLNANATIERMTLNSPAPVAAPAPGASTAIVTAASGARLRHVSLDMEVDPNLARQQIVGVQSVAGDAQIDNCIFTGEDGFQQGFFFPPRQTTAVLFSGSKGADLNPATSGWVRGCVLTGWNVGAHWLDCAKGIVDDCEFIDIAAQNAMRWETSGNFTVGTSVYGPRWTNCRISFDATESENAPAERVGCYVRVNHAAFQGDFVFDVLIDNITCRFAPQQGQNVQDSIGVWLHVARGDVSVHRGAIRGILNEGHAVGVRVSAFTFGDVGPSAIEDVRIDSVVARNSQNQAVVSGRGVWIEGSGAGTARRISVMNSSCGESPVGGAGVEIDSNCEDCHVGFNHLTTAAGTALIDAGVATEVGHNITV